MNIYSVGYTEKFLKKVEGWSNFAFPNDSASVLISRRKEVLDFCDSHDQLPSRMTFYADLSESIQVRVGIYAYAKRRDSKIFLGAVVDSDKYQVVFMSLSYKRGGLLQAGRDTLTEA